jgi:hypothetical protein
VNLLGAVLYDPAVAVTKGTIASAMAAFDTTNARISFTAPASGMALVRIACVVHGATTFSTILLGVMSGASVIGRACPIGGLKTTAVATAMVTQEVKFVVPGLTPGASLTWDAAWGIETFVASSLIKYGGPNDATVNNAFGALQFEIWDPCPVYTPSAGAPPTTPVSDRIDTIDNFVDTEIADIQARLPAALVSGRMDASVGAMAANVITAASMATDAGAEIADAVWDEAIAGHLTAGTTGAQLNAAGAGGDPWSTALPGAYAAGTAGKIIGDKIVASVTGAVGSVTGSVGSVTGAVGSVTGNVTGSVGSVVGLTAANLDVAVSTRLATAGYTAPPSAATNASAVRAELTTELGRIDATVSSRAAATDLATVAGYLDTEVAAIKAKTDNLPAAPASTGDVTTVGAEVTAIKAQTDQLAFTVAGQVDANMKSVAGTTVTGVGSEADPWGP